MSRQPIFALPSEVRLLDGFKMIPRFKFLLLALAVGIWFADRSGAAESRRPNIFFAIADDWSWPHAGAYGDEVVQMPTFDRVAREGVLFTQAFVSSPSCTPSRAAILTGQWHWRLEESANLWSTLQKKFETYPELLRNAGYRIGHSRKAWGPGQLAPGGRTQDPSGPNYRNFAQFLEGVQADQPFCFWFGSPDPHRPYDWESGKKSGMALDKIRVPPGLPDHEIVRTDLADYYWEVQRFDREVGEALALLEVRGALDNTIVVITGDNGLPFPRAKSNLYDTGTRVPLAVRWPARVKAGRVLTDFISLTDLAPTFLEAAGLKPTAAMTGRSFLKLLLSNATGRVDSTRDRVFFGKERHVPSQETGNTGGYPSRAIRTDRFLFVRNFEPDRWPNGMADAKSTHLGRVFADCDAGPTKDYLLRTRDQPSATNFFALAFGKRPAEELYDLSKDPGQLRNVAGQASYAAAQKELAGQLQAELKATKDPRIVGGAELFDRYPYYGGAPENPRALPRP